MLDLLHYRLGFSLVPASRGYSLVVMHKLLIVVTPLVGEARALGPVGTVGAAPGL